MLNVRLEAIKLLEENLRKKLLDIGLGNEFFVCDIRNKRKKKLLELHKASIYKEKKKKKRKDPQNEKAT